MIEIELKENLGRRLDEMNSKIEGFGGDSTLSQPSSNQLELAQNELSALTGSIEESNTQLTSKFEHLPSLIYLFLSYQQLIFSFAIDRIGCIKTLRTR
jgi:hypothetical protein